VPKLKNLAELLKLKLEGLDEGGMPRYAGMPLFLAGSQNLPLCQSSAKTRDFPYPARFTALQKKNLRAKLIRLRTFGSI
jgi:hypothetical protein